MGGETLGFPNWFPFPQGNIWGTLLPIDPSCEFGPCVPIGNDYLGGVRRGGSGGAQYTFVVEVWDRYGPPSWTTPKDKWKFIEQMALSLDASKVPLYNIATSAALFGTGVVLVGGSVYFAGAICLGSGGLACGAAIYAGAHVAFGGIILIRGGYQFTRDVTIPGIWRPGH